MNLTELIKLERKKADKGWEYWTCGNYDTMYDYGTEIGYNQCLSDLKGIEIELDEDEFLDVILDAPITGEAVAFVKEAISSNLSRILRVKK